MSCGDRNFVQAAACTATTVAHNLSLWATAIRPDRGKNGVARPAVVARGAASGSEATGRTTLICPVARTPRPCGTSDSDGRTDEASVLQQPGKSKLFDHY